MTSFRCASDSVLISLQPCFGKLEMKNNKSNRRLFEGGLDGFNHGLKD